MKTLLAMIIAVAIPVSFLVVPMAFMRSSADMGACLENLKQIDGMANAYMLENKRKETDSYSLTNKAMLSYLKGGILPVCPAGGSYLAGKTYKDEPACSVHGSLAKIIADLPGQRAAEWKHLGIVIGPFIAAVFLWLFWWRKTAAIAA